MGQSIEIVIVGAGGFGREIFHWARAAYEGPGYRIKGFLARDGSDLRPHGIAAPLLGHEDGYRVDEQDRMILAIGDIDRRVRVVGRLKGAGARFLTLVHPTAQVVPTATLGEGVVICPFALVSANAVLGDFSVLNFFASCGHDAKIGAHSVLSPYAVVTGAAELGERVFMGTHATVVPMRRVGAGSRISANSVVMRDVPTGSFVYGVPGRSQLLFDSGEGPSTP